MSGSIFDEQLMALLSLYHTDQQSPVTPRFDKENWIFFKSFVMFNDSVMKSVRKRYEYSLDLAGFCLKRHDTVTN